MGGMARSASMESGLPVNGGYLNSGFAGPARFTDNAEQDAMDWQSSLDCGHGAA